MSAAGRAVARPCQQEGRARGVQDLESGMRLAPVREASDGAAAASMLTWVLRQSSPGNQGLM